MNQKLFLLFFFGILFSAQAQKNGVITAKVIDKSTKVPISYASVVLKESGKIVTGGITDDNGFFEIKNLELKNYSVEVQFIGYQTYISKADFTAGVKDINLGTIDLQSEATELQGVNIIAERSTIEQKIDRKVINVGKDLTTAGATASEIMNNIPSVNIDQDGKISLRGNDNVRVLIDGKPTNMDPAQLLKQIPSTSIKKIELITNPSAKYNPEGMSGIINIILQKNASNGFNASVNAGLTFAKTPKTNNSIDLNYRTGKVNFFANYGNNFGNQYNEGLINRLDSAITQTINIKDINKTHLFKVGVDYYLNDKNTLSVYTNQNYFKGDGFNQTNYYYPMVNNDFNSKDRYLKDNTSGTYDMAYKHLFAKEGHTLDFEANYNDSKNIQDIDFNRDFTPYNPTDATYRYQDYILDNRKSTTVNLDYVNPITEKSTLELGAESRTTRTDNIYNTTGNLLNSSIYSYDTDIYSAYVTFGQKFKKISYQLGARFESYKVDAELNLATAYKDDYLTLYPSAYLTYAMNEKDNFQLSYSRRVDRPSLEQTNPIPEFSSAKLISIGNPKLNPQFTNSFELNYTRSLTKGSVTAGIFYRIINDEISRILYPNPDRPGDQFLSYDNYDHNTAFGFELSTNYKFNSWWDIQPAIDFSSINQKGIVSILRPGTTNTFDPTLTEITSSAFNARVNSNFKATKNVRFLLFGFYRGEVQGIQFNRKPMYKVDAGVRFNVLNDKGSLSIRFNDLFNTMRFAFDGVNPYPQSGQFTWESQSIYIGFNYGFGAGKNRALQRKQRDDNTKQSSGGLF